MSGDRLAKRRFGDQRPLEGLQELGAVAAEQRVQAPADSRNRHGVGQRCDPSQQLGVDERHVAADHDDRSVGFPQCGDDAEQRMELAGRLLDQANAQLRQRRLALRDDDDLMAA